MVAGSGGPNLAEERRRELGAAFLAGGAHYERVRPGYPLGITDWLVPPGASAVLDVGAGTGKFTERLVDRRGLDLTAVDPSADMLAQLHQRLPGVRTLVGTAERLPLPDASVDAAVVAQAWHWFDPLAASAELARVLRAGGTLGLVWNQLDVSVQWVHRLSRIMHAGDVHRPGFQPAIGPEFAALQSRTERWEQPVTPADLVELAKSRSYYLRAKEAHRNKLLANLHWYLYDHLDHTLETSLVLPYVTQAWRARRNTVALVPGTAEG